MLSTITLLVIIDLMCVFTINRPLFAIKENDQIYRGLFFDTYNCMEYSMMQIKPKGMKMICASDRLNIGKVIAIEDKTIACVTVKEEFYRDDEYIYYWNCLKNENVIVKYENGYEEMVSDGLNYGSVMISDLDEFNIRYIKEKK